MAVKLTGAELKSFYNDSSFWPDKAWYEDETIVVDGKIAGNDFRWSTVPNESVVTIYGGFVYDLTDDKDYGPSLEGHFKKWRKLQNTARISVECKKSMLDAVKAAIKSAGGKVL